MHIHIDVSIYTLRYGMVNSIDQHTGCDWSSQRFCMETFIQTKPPPGMYPGFTLTFCVNPIIDTNAVWFHRLI